MAEKTQSGVTLRTASDSSIQAMLRLAREYFDFDVAFISEFEQDRRVFRFVDARADDPPVVAGGSDPLEGSYCHYVSTGVLPPFIRDPWQYPVAAQLPVTANLPVGTHMSVPIVLGDGSVYGTFCCFSHTVDHRVGEPDLRVVQMLAALVADLVEHDGEAERQRADRRTLLTQLQPGMDLAMVFQPITDLVTGRVEGVEALARFPGLGLDPASVFAEAWRLDAGLDLELTAFDLALQHLPDIPDGAYLAINVSPETVICTDLLQRIGAAGDPHRVVVEITEHAAVRDYSLLVPAVRRLEEAGARLAIDDVGAGISGLEHIVRLRPSILKLDGSLVDGVDASLTQQALISALVMFAGRTQAWLVGEKIERDADLNALRILGVPYGQGYLLGRPGPLTAPE